MLRAGRAPLIYKIASSDLRAYNYIRIGDCGRNHIRDGQDEEKHSNLLDDLSPYSLLVDCQPDNFEPRSSLIALISILNLCHEVANE
jgi:hypothetical protein